MVAGPCRGAESARPDRGLGLDSLVSSPDEIFVDGGIGRFEASGACR
jgi:hypothetical protein